MSEKMREDFEEWFSEYSLPCEGDWFKRDSCGDYDSPSTHDAWMGWKASRAAMVVELPPEVICERTEFYYDGWNDAANQSRLALDEVGIKHK